MISTIISFILLTIIVAMIIIRRTRIKKVSQPTPTVPPTQPLPPAAPTPAASQPTQAIPPTPIATPTPPIAQPSSDIDGTWNGVLNTGVAQLTFELQIISNNAGTCNATMGCIEQGTSGILIDTISLHDNSLTFAIKSMRITYEGVLSENKQAFRGTFTQFGQQFPLTFARIA
jgi:hypothetical protein